MDSDERYFINLILKYLFPEKLSKDETKEILENLKGKEDDTMFIENTYIVVKRGKKNSYIGKRI